MFDVASVNLMSRNETQTFHDRTTDCSSLNKNKYLIINFFYFLKIIQALFHAILDAPSESEFCLSVYDWYGYILIIITYPSFIFSLVFTSIYIRTFEDKAMFFFSCNPCKCYSNRD